MMTSLECLAKADQLDSIARGCGHQSDREASTEVALGWRRNAVVARQQ